MLWRNRARMKAVGFHPKRRGASGHGTLFILFLILLLNSALGNILKDERNRSLVPLLRLSSACQAELNAQRECKTIERDARRRIGGSASNVKTRKGGMSRGEAPLQSLGGVSLKRRLAHPIRMSTTANNLGGGGACYTFFFLKLSLLVWPFRQQKTSIKRQSVRPSSFQIFEKNKKKVQFLKLDARDTTNYLKLFFN